MPGPQRRVSAGHRQPGPAANQLELMRICTVIGATAIVATATAGGQHAFAAEGRSTPAAAARSHPKDRHRTCGSPGRFGGLAERGEDDRGNR